MTQKKNKKPSYLKKTPFERAQDRLFWASFKKSAIIHGGLFLAVIITSVVGLFGTQRIQPSIRVDLVGLPDLTKKELAELSPTAAEKTEVKEKKKSKSKKDSMKFKKKKKRLSRKSKNKRAIERLKALQKIQDSLKTEAKAKGNVLSKGNSLTGTQGISVNDYAAQIESKVRSNWKLPVWLSQQDYSAKTDLMLDANGGIITVVLAESSGNQQFDDYCVKAVRQSEPFGPPPKELQHKRITLGFPL